MLFHPVLVTEQGMIGVISQNKLNKIEILFFSEIFEVALPLKTGYRNRKWLWKHGYRNRIWLWKLVTGTENGHQIWLPEQNVAIKYGYRNRKWSSNMVTGTKPGHQIWLPEQLFFWQSNSLKLHMMVTMVMMDILNIISTCTPCSSSNHHHGGAQIHSTITARSLPH